MVGTTQWPDSTSVRHILIATVNPQNGQQVREDSIAKKLADSAIKKYTELYDFSPSGYFTINREGVIIEANRTSAEMLLKEGKDLVNTKFRSFVTPDTRMEFDILKK